MKKLTVIFFLLCVFAPSLALAYVAPPIRDASFRGSFVSQSVPDPIAITGGESREVILKMKNVGESTWRASGANFISAYAVDPNYRDSDFSGSGWIANNQPAKVSADTAPGKIGEFKIKLYAPIAPGKYREKFYLASENKTWIKGTLFYFDIVVKEGEASVVKPIVDESESVIPPDATSTPVAIAPVEGDLPPPPLEEVAPRDRIAEPHIRVGLYKTKETVDFISDYSYQVFTGEELQGELSGGDAVTLSYSKGKYRFASPALSFESDKFIVLKPYSLDAYFTLPKYQRIVAGRGKASFNSYRGSLEYRYSPKSEMPYIINELSLDFYVSGIAEMSNSNPTEYIKALLIAARSYAFQNVSAEPPSDSRMFDVYPNTVDQIYLGYNSEKQMPKVTAAADETYGLMVTYNRAPALTMYFGNSDGKTKTFKSSYAVRPWLTSVIAKYDKGKKMWGHGYGMSCYDAIHRALDDKWTYEEILRHYYQGTRVEKVY